MLERKTLWLSDMRGKTNWWRIWGIITDVEVLWELGHFLKRLSVPSRPQCKQITALCQAKTASRLLRGQSAVQTSADNSRKQHSFYRKRNNFFSLSPCFGSCVGLSSSVPGCMVGHGSASK